MNKREQKMQRALHQSIFADAADIAFNRLTTLKRVIEKYNARKKGLKNED